MRSPVLEDNDNFDDFDLSQFDRRATQHRDQEDDKEKSAFPASQLSIHLQEPDDAVRQPGSPCNSQRQATPHHDATDDSPLRAISEIANQSGRLSPHGHTTAVPGSAGARTLKRKLAEVVDNRISMHPAPYNDSFPDQPIFQSTFPEMADDYTEMTNNFNPTEEEEQKAKILEFNNELLHKTMTMSLLVSHSLFATNESTRKKLVDMLAKIRNEEEKHRQNVVKFRRFAELLDSGMKALGSEDHERGDNIEPRMDAKRRMSQAPGDSGPYRQL
ncbi:hypothetical protein CspeluHIS016_0210290 [Cutaneotrichosporon spelunceum]|uniref:Uncharacterized protein n=1 Tax=Cutaneotrichosporon spelunceum TaxID=1672016 RepID=A0AAD3YBC9_9TREE|nr:hypothetical protein CspeluHIS016_0210290 [Cutaneotrichosporon spelunceum]